MKKVVGLVVIVALIAGVSMTAFAGWGKRQEEQAAPASQAVPAAQPQQPAEYTGEITDDMITSFLKVDRKRRMILQQAEAAVRQTLQTEQLDPQIYLAVAKKIQKDQTFLERVRGVAAKMMESEMSAQQAAAPAAGAQQ